jgi:uncharacterized protein
MAVMDIDRNGLEVLSREECVRLLGETSLGRIGVHVSSLPVVLPVNYALDGDSIVFRTGEGSKLDAATRNAVVAFEVDDVDPVYHEGWSVMVTGMAREVTDADEIEQLSRLPLAHWAPVPGRRFVRVPLELVSGRRLSRIPAPV